MNAHQRRIAHRLYERAFGNHVDYMVTISLYPNKTDGHGSYFTAEWETAGVLCSCGAAFLCPDGWRCPERLALIDPTEDEAARAK